MTKEEWCGVGWERKGKGRKKVGISSLSKKSLIRRQAQFVVVAQVD